MSVKVTASMRDKKKEKEKKKQTVPVAAKPEGHSIRKGGIMTTAPSLRSLAWGPTENDEQMNEWMNEHTN